MLYTIDEWRKTGCFTPLMNKEKRNALHHSRMERDGMLYTVDEWRETECFTPLMNDEKRDALHH